MLKSKLQNQKRDEPPALLRNSAHGWDPTPLFTLHCPQVIQARGVALTYHFPTHAPVRIARYTRSPERTPTPSPIDFVQYRHHPCCLIGLRNGEQIVRVFTRLAEI